MSGGVAAKEWTVADLRTIGFFAKIPGRRPEWLQAPQVEWVCSVACCDCSAESPARWIQAWLHNELWVFDSLALLERVLPVADAAQFLRYGLKALPVLFDFDDDAQRAMETTWDLSVVQPEPIPSHFVRLGYDLCSRMVGNDLESSPLSCCYEAVRIPTNRWCLIDDLATALRVAREFAAAGGKRLEPGPYALLEVWADRTPGA